MQNCRLSELSEPVRLFLTDAIKGDGFVIADDAGRPEGSFVPCRYPTDEQKQRPYAGMKDIWKHTSNAMQESGATEGDIDRIQQHDYVPRWR